jgi:hypothetical protein
VIVGTPAGNTANFDALLEYFRTGEIWGINAESLRQGEQGRNKYLYTYHLEEMLIARLRSAMRFHQEVSGIGPPFWVEVGAVGVAARTIADRTCHKPRFSGLGERRDHSQSFATQNRRSNTIVLPDGVL